MSTMNKQRADEIVNEILNDLTDRSGLGNEWDNIDSDIQKEIKEAWAEIIQKYAVEPILEHEGEK